LMVSVLSLGFMLMTPQTPFPYFAEPVNGYVYQVPTSMLLNTLPKVDCEDAVNALQWFKNNAGSSAVLLTHRAFFGWAMLSVNASQIVLYEYNDPAGAAATGVQQGHGGVYLIWWVNGTGWYGQPTVSSPFEEVYHSGEIAIYHYGASS
jgi:hypothetical protein